MAGRAESFDPGGEAYLRVPDDVEAAFDALRQRRVVRDHRQTHARAADHSADPLMLGAYVALTAIGLSTDFDKMRHTGWRPVALGMLVWISVACTSLMMQNLTACW